ncbi:ABC transporter ATP-binding protein [Nonomuraea sp. NPDC046802]|uniref:ABC transporter ATP-binding protein n=1 Tax=Nonomuraea sp. NPDC046802 TaxID=3154919 RepID=UPI0033C9AB2D
MALLELHDLAVSAGRRRPLLERITLTVDSGEALGLVGESGSGKSLTARAILKVFPNNSQVSGRVTFDGDSVLDMDASALQRYRRTQVAMIFQDPFAAINPLRSIGDFLAEGLRVSQGLNRRAAEERAVQLLDSVGISRARTRLRHFPHEFSGGMLQRVMIAGALGSGARLILADEPTTALDVSIQAEVVLLLDELRKENDLALLFITHDLDLAVAICDRIAVMYAGRVVEDRPAVQLYDQPRHPYTAALIGCRPAVDERVDRLASIPGNPVSAATAPNGCSFNERCSHAVDLCRLELPDLTAEADGRVRCHRSVELAETLVSGRRWTA